MRQWGRFALAPLLACLLAACGSQEESQSSLQGRLVLDTAAADLDAEILLDLEGFADRPELRVTALPPFDFEYIQSGDQLLPVKTGPVPDLHPHWEYLLGVGRVSAVGKEGARKILLPLSLQERNANCVHNGVLDFSLDADGAITAGYFEIASETCRYFKLNLRGSLDGRFVSGAVANTDEVLSQFARWRAARLPVRPFTELIERFPGTAIEEWANTGAVDPQNMTAWGLVDEGVHYRGACQTRSGDYPLCEQLFLPSYSTAKSLFAGLALMRMEKLFPGVSQRLISDYVPRCSGAEWDGVRFVDALDMATGNFESSVHQEDEANPDNIDGFFYPETHEEKITYSCTAYPRRAPPGSQWVYHTTDTYVLSAALGAFLRKEMGPEADLYHDIIRPLWDPLQLSPALAETRRSYDERAQPWMGFGLTYLPDDIARLAQALSEGVFNKDLDAAMINAALQREAAPHGRVAEVAPGKFDRYSHGFFALDLGRLLNCETATWIPYLSGYGGILVALLPGDSIYYYFSDGGEFSLSAPLKALHRARPLC